MSPTRVRAYQGRTIHLTHGLLVSAPWVYSMCGRRLYDPKPYDGDKYPLCPKCAAKVSQ